MLHPKTHWIQALVLCALSATAAFAAPPDLTGPGAIAALKTDPNSTPVYGDTYNLGPTGLRGPLAPETGKPTRAQRSSSAPALVDFRSAL